MKLNIQLFAHTNKTANYDLPQFVGTDKPTWLGDFNEAMSDIDAGMHKNASDIATMQSDVASATQAASQASQDVTTLTGTVTTLSGTVASVQTTANNASQTASSALNTANTANSKADTNASAITTINGKLVDIDGNILWTNSNPSASFTGQTITLSEAITNYDCYEILFEESATNPKMLSTGKVLSTHGTTLNYVARYPKYRHTTNTISGTSIQFEDCYSLDMAHDTTIVENNSLIPLYVIGYNTGLF